jgi:hypothetical protein
MRHFPLLALCAAPLLAACDPKVPDSAAGVGFGDYSAYIRQRDAALAAGTPAPVAPPLTAAAPAAPATGFSTDRIGAVIDAADGSAPAAPVATATAPVAPAPAAPAPAAPANGSRPRADTFAGIASTNTEVDGVAAGTNPATISDENDFSAVSARETIQSDAERIARNRAQYVVDQPTAVPERPGNTGPNIVAFAVSTTHAPGTPVYRRSNFGKGDPSGKCARYGSPDRAQEAFLEAGGPERDKLGIDPDGDGFACLWDPRPFRTALQ